MSLALDKSGEVSRSQTTFRESSEVQRLLTLTCSLARKPLSHLQQQNQHDDRCHIPSHPRSKAFRLKHVQRNPLHALAASVSAHFTGLEFNPQSRSNNFPCAYLPAVLKRHPTLYHFLTSSPQHYHLCPRLCRHSVHVMQPVCEDFVGITLLDSTLM